MSLGANIDQKRIEKKRNYCFRIHGSVYHYIGSLFSEQQKDSKFAQIYIFDIDFQTETRMKLMPSLNRDILTALQNMIQTCNPYVKLFRTAAASMESNSNNLQMIIKSDSPNKDVRRYNKPTSSDVAIVIPGDGSETFKSRDIIINKQDGDKTDFRIEWCI